MCSRLYNIDRVVKSFLLAVQTLPVRGGPGAPPNNPEHTQWWKDMCQNLNGIEMSRQDMQRILRMPVHPEEPPTTPVRNPEFAFSNAMRHTAHITKKQKVLIAFVHS